jgi:hypothetical protein
LSRSALAVGYGAVALNKSKRKCVMLVSVSVAICAAKR